MAKFFKSIPNFVWLFFGAILSLWVGCFLISILVDTWAFPAMFITVIAVFAGLFIGGLVSVAMWVDSL